MLIAYNIIVHWTVILNLILVEQENSQELYWTYIYHIWFYKLKSVNVWKFIFHFWVAIDIEELTDRRISFEYGGCGTLY